jgi:hypothetical protein
MKSKILSIKWLVIAMIFSGCTGTGHNVTENTFITGKSVEKVQEELINKNGEKYKERILKGSEQLAKNWRKADGNNEDYIKFCVENFLNEDELKSNFERIQTNIGVQNGYLAKIRYRINESESFTYTTEVKADKFFRKSIPSADAYKEKLALFIQLNFPWYSLNEKREKSKIWNRENWAMARIGDLYSERLDPDFKADAEDEVKEFQKYIGKYFFRMDHICMPDGSYPFSKPLTLHCHFGLRDNLKEEYTRQGGLNRQIITGKLIDHITDGTIPVQFIQDSSTRWNPWTNKLYKKEQGKYVEIEYKTEGTKRYAGLLAEFKNKSSFDKLYPHGSTALNRTFDNANLTLQEVETLLRNFLSDPVIALTGKLISQRLGRPLQPFDIWYSGFQAQSAFPANMLDSLTKAKYPNPMALQKDLPSILIKMGFSASDAGYIGQHAIVRPIISGGYSDQPPMRGDTALMTTVFNPNGLDYKAFRISMHELGHVVCGIYTTRDIDYSTLADVPTSGITEGIAEMMAFKNTEGLGLKKQDFKESKDLLSLASLWYMVDLGGQSLTEIETWKWMYAHPEASPEELRSAVLNISAEIWNKYYASVFDGIKDQHILAIYNHFITGSMYLFNYFVGDMVMFQLYDAFMPDNLSSGLKKACLEGLTLPQLWMEHATGKEMSMEPILRTAKEAISKNTIKTATKID